MTLTFASLNFGCVCARRFIDTVTVRVRCCTPNQRWKKHIRLQCAVRIAGFVGRIKVACMHSSAQANLANACCALGKRVGGIRLQVKCLFVNFAVNEIIFHLCRNWSVRHWLSANCEYKPTEFVLDSLQFGLIENALDLVCALLCLVVHSLVQNMLQFPMV